MEYGWEPRRSAMAGGAGFEIGLPDLIVLPVAEGSEGLSASCLFSFRELSCFHFAHQLNDEAAFASSTSAPFATSKHVPEPA